MILRLPDTAEAASLTYLAWLAYPGAHEAHRRDTFIKASAFYLHRGMEIAPRNMPAPIRGMKPNRAVKTIESAWSQIVHRRVASVYAWLRLLEHRRGVGSVTNEEGVEVDVNGADTLTKAGASWADFISKYDEISARSVADEYGSDFRKRTWRPSLPVMPMAIAFCFSRQSIEILSSRIIGQTSLDAGNVQMDGPMLMGPTGCITTSSWVREAAQVAQTITDKTDTGIIFPVF